MVSRRYADSVRLSLNANEAVLTDCVYNCGVYEMVLQRRFSCNDFISAQFNGHCRSSNYDALMGGGAQTWQRSSAEFLWPGWPRCKQVALESYRTRQAFVHYRRYDSKSLAVYKLNRKYVNHSKFSLDWF